eukprot:COSAG01_NODE_31776_length_591_cov_4.231707_1_plen_49_part_10
MVLLLPPPPWRGPVQWRRVDLVAKRLILSGHYACAVRTHMLWPAPPPRP